AWRPRADGSLGRRTAQRARGRHGRRGHEDAPAAVGEEQPLDGGVDDGAVDVAAVVQPQGDRLPVAGPQAVHEGDLRELGLGEVEHLRGLGRPARVLELALEVVEEGLPAHPSTAVRRAGAATAPGPPPGHEGSGAVHMCIKQHQPPPSDTEEMHVDVLRPPLAAAAALAATWLLTTWAGDLVGSGLARVDDVVALATAVGGAAVAAWYAVTALALTLAQGVRL